MNDLKQQLATQEVELNKKNEEADKLIEIVGVETERVSREKSIADEEELKVNQINREVSVKQKDCEEDLKKAEPGSLKHFYELGEALGLCKGYTKGYTKH